MKKIYCKYCSYEKLENEFSNTNLKYKSPKCKECVKNYNANNYKDNKKNIIKQKRKYQNDNKDKIKIYAKKYRKDNKKDIEEYMLEYRKDNKEQISIKAKLYRETHKEQIEKYEKEYKQIHKDNIYIYQKTYMLTYLEENKIELRDKKNIYENNKRNTNPIFKCKKDISKQINIGLRKQGSSKKGVSCWSKLQITPEQLMQHLESHFADPENLTPDGKVWMTRFNRSIYKKANWDDNNPDTWVWNIDHIIPQSDLPYTSMDDDNFKKCWALENLRPLSAKQNQSDGVRRLRHFKKENDNEK